AEAAEAAGADTAGAARASGADRAAGPDLAAGGHPGAAGSRTEEISTERFPWLLDHCLVRQRPGWRTDDHFPVVPLTTMVRWMLDAAEGAHPGRVAVAIEAIRATRWLSADPPVEVTLSVTGQGPGRVRVAVEGYAQGTVLLADGYPPAPAPATDPLPDDEPSLIDAEELYSQRWMFHGPQFHVVRALHGIGESGIRGRLRALPAPGTLLDGAGQLVGYWVMARTTSGRIVLPTGITRIDLYGPEPAPPTEVEAGIRITGLDEATVRADLELVAGGRTWARIEGWTERRFATDGPLWDALRFPEYHLVSEPRPGGWVLTPERCRRTASRELVMRQYLGRRERDHYESLNPGQRRQWLLGRLAAKDAVRHWLWDNGSGPLFPAEVEVTTHEGAPEVRGPWDADVRVSVAHCGTVAVAAVAEGSPVGIDVEAVSPRGDAFTAAALSAREEELVPAVDRDGWLTRFWVAKEAVAKAAGSGLGGRPRHFEVVEVSGSSLRVGDHWVDTETVGDEQGGELVVGWTRFAHARALGG
ncbi:MAG: 4'-phosphopantetheinyl transferase superfamily protein, partial [Acidimicrobiales bacterium]